MNTQMMEGLLGASSNIRLSDTPMSVYRQASAEGDAEKMKRALGYAGECTEKAVGYQEKLEKGMEEEAKAEREKEKLEQEAAVEKRREESKVSDTVRVPEHRQDTDLVRISETAKAALKERPAETAGPACLSPVIYAGNGEISGSPAEPEPVVSVSA